MVNAVENMRMREIAKQWRCIYGRSTNSSISSIILLLISSLFALRRDYWSCLKYYLSMKVQCRRGIIVRNYATRFCFTLSTAEDTVKNIRKFIHKRNAAVKISFSNRWVRKSEIKIIIYAERLFARSANYNVKLAEARCSFSKARSRAFWGAQKRNHGLCLRAKSVPSVVNINNTVPCCRHEQKLATSPKRRSRVWDIWQRNYWDWESVA